MTKLILFLLFCVWLSLSAIQLLLIGGLVFELHLKNWNGESLPFLFGCGLSFIIVVGIKPFRWRSVNYITTFIHELTHAIAAILTKAKPKMPKVYLFPGQSGKAGSIEYTAKNSLIMGFVRNHLVSLAPYFLPLFLGLFLVFLVFAEMLHEPVSLFLAGLIWLTGILLTINEAKPYQSDFRLGYLYGLSFILFMQFLFFTVMVLVLSSNPDKFAIFCDLIKDIAPQIRFLLDLLK
jgi:peptidase M50B-like protein